METVLAAQWYDGAIVIPGCDKNMPGVIMGGELVIGLYFRGCDTRAVIPVARVNRPAIMVYGGTIRAGCTRGGIGGPSAPKRRVDIVSAFEAYGEYLAGRLTDSERADVIETACPGPGACELWL